MHLDLTGHHVDITPSMRAYVHKKMDRIVRHFDHNMIDVHCILTVEKPGHKAEATLMVRGGKIYADASNGNMYVAIDALTDKLDRLVRKHKEKRKDHHAAEARHSNGHATV